MPRAEAAAEKPLWAKDPSPYCPAKRKKLLRTERLDLVGNGELADRSGDSGDLRLRADSRAAPQSRAHAHAHMDGGATRQGLTHVL